MIAILWRLAPDSTRAQRQQYMGLLAAVVVTRAATCLLLVPVLSELFSDEPSKAWPWIALFAAAVLAHGFFQFRLARTGFSLGLAFMASLQHRLLEHLAQVPLGWVSGSRRATAQRAIATTGAEVAQTIGNLVTPFILSLTLPFAIAIGLLLVAWPLGLAALVATPLLLASWWGANRCSQRADATYAESVKDLDDRIIEFSRTQRTLRGARRADPERSAAGDALRTQHAAVISLLRWSVPGQLLFSITAQLTLLALAITALWLIGRGDVSVAEAVALLVVAVRFLEPFANLAELTPAMQASTTTLRGIDEVLSAPALAQGSDASPSATGGIDQGEARTTAPEVRIEGVRFRHPDAATTTIDGIDLVAPAGKTTAIVGPSGAGKSTLLSLIARFHDVDEGRVLVGECDVRSLAPADLYRDLSMVFQDVYLFEGSIRDNVLVGRPDADEATLAQAASFAQVDEIVARLPAGWDAPVGEGGVALSGGERQRVGIARALAKGAPLLLVDEATSSLDPVNERAVAAALTSGAGRRTTVVVAHRMQTIAQADHIVFIDEGRVVEAGSRTELLSLDGRFAAFHRDQTESSAWTIGHT